jgi:DNA-directed DNA polymerase III PolC
VYINCHSYFSLKYGTMSPEALVNEGYDKEAQVLAITDINNTSAVFAFHNACRAKGIKPVAGIEFRNGDELLYIGLAKNNKGFQELNAFLSRYNVLHTPLPSQAPEFNEVFIIYPWGKKEPAELRTNEYIGVRIQEINRFSVSEMIKRQDKLVMLHPVTFKDKRGHSTHRLLRAIDKNTLLSRLNTDEQAQADECMLPVSELLHKYGRFPRIIQNTMKLLDLCSIEFNNESKNKKLFTTDANDDRLLLEKLALDGLEHRYGSKNKEARARVFRELEIINKLGFNAYFLITWDILRYAVSKSFAYVGRGSGANSIVAYCLRITDVDPIELDLYFERFLNPYRSSPPDFDIDFAHNERDHVTDYIFKRYGLQKTALLATYNTFKGKSIIRELGKVFGLPKPEIDAITKNPELSAGKEKDKIVGMILKFGRELENIPNYLSIHAGGILIGEDPISCYTATDLPPKGFPITHFDMFVAEDMGFYKYDILSQRGLGHIRDAVKLVQKNTGKIIEINTEEAKKDKKVEEYISSANTIGCFYIESPGMRMLLRKLKCSDYLTLVAASSIIRPGVAQSGMMQQYIERFHHPEEVEYLHPKMGELLKETFGVMVYQEDVIKVAHHFGGLDLGKADTLRRAMSGKYKGMKGFDIVREEFFTSCRKLGYEEALIKEVWRQMESFGGYSFSKAHSASFAVESYHSLYLKAHYPLEFMVAVLNNEGGFYSREFYLHEARMWGADIQPPCINHGEYYNDIAGKTIYVGFRYVKELETKIAEAIPMERKAGGMYKDIYDFVKRIPVSQQQLTLLIRTGAFRFTGKSKKVLLLEAAMLFSKTKVKVQGPELFESERSALQLPELKSFSFEDAYDQIELFEFPLCFPFDLLPPEQNMGVLSTEMMNHTGRRVTMVGYFVTLKYLYTSKRDLMSFAHFFDREGKCFDTTHFPPSLKRYPFKGNGFYKMTGKVVQEFGYPSIEVETMVKLPLAKKEIIKERSLPSVGMTKLRRDSSLRSE